MHWANVRWRGRLLIVGFTLMISTGVPARATICNTGLNATTGEATLHGSNVLVGGVFVDELVGRTRHLLLMETNLSDEQMSKYSLQIKVHRYKGPGPYSCHFLLEDESPGSSASRCNGRGDCDVTVANGSDPNIICSSLAVSFRFHVRRVSGLCGKLPLLGSFALSAQRSVSPTPTVTPLPATPTAHVSTPTSTTSPAPAFCVGDCQGTGHVTIADLVTLINIALEISDVSACPHGVEPGITVDVTTIIQAVNKALNGC